MYSVIYTKYYVEKYSRYAVRHFNQIQNDDHLEICGMDEVAKHRTKEDRIWIAYKDGVYDVTEFVNVHPGGQIIMTAAGSYADQLFKTYPFHEKFIEDGMSNLRVRRLKKDDMDKNRSHLYDPYANDPLPSSDLNIIQSKPICGGPSSLEKLIEQYITPKNLFYVRNHLPMPIFNDDVHEIVVSGVGVPQQKQYRVNDLKTKFKKHSVQTTLQCAGNRRNEMNKVGFVQGAEWRENAMYNAVWSGVLLHDLLQDCGFEEKIENLHIQFEGMDLDPKKSPYGASIPASKLDPVYEVILAYEVNGDVVPAEHGHPVRVIIPGVAGARNVKWLSNIKISYEESQCHYQQGDYKGFSPSVTGDTPVDFASVPAVQELPVTSVICNLQDNEKVQFSNGSILVKGYAYSGGGRKIVRVDITADGGDKWVTADLTHNTESTSLIYCWSWTLWEAKIPKEIVKIDKNSQVEIWAKAVDSSYNAQPESFKDIWNFLGVICNAYHRVPVIIENN